MNARKRKALERLLAHAKTHIGHTITTRQDLSAVLKDVQIHRETVMLRIQGEYFPTIYIDEVKKCSCGE